MRRYKGASSDTPIPGEGKGLTIECIVYTTRVRKGLREYVDMRPQPAGAAGESAALVLTAVDAVFVAADASAGGTSPGGGGGGTTPPSAGKRQRRTPVASPEDSPGEAAAPS